MTAAESLLRQQLNQRQPAWMPWAEVMQLALYHPEVGYYSGKPRRLGRSGDFYTAVSVGPLYGQLIAQQAADLWQAAGRPTGFVVAEQAAHDGQLMLDVLSALEQHHPELAARVSPHIIEPKIDYRTAQQEKLTSYSNLVWMDEISDLQGEHGLLICNELLDAFPVHRLVKVEDHWHELGVRLSNDDQLDWQPMPILPSSRLDQATRQLPPNLPSGHITELHLAIEDWISQLATSLFRGHLWMADYGLDASEYWSPSRPNGTLRRYFEHRMDNRVLEHLGEADLTTHINLGTMIETACDHGIQLQSMADQGRFLTRLAAPWLRAMESNGKLTPALIRQFQTLTHPGIMGQSFQIALLHCRGA